MQLTAALNIVPISRKLCRQFVARLVLFYMFGIYFSRQRAVAGISKNGLFHILIAITACFLSSVVSYFCRQKFLVLHSCHLRLLAKIILII